VLQKVGASLGKGQDSGGIYISIAGEQDRRKKKKYTFSRSSSSYATD
jgi:hypothetical protein